MTIEGFPSDRYTGRGLIVGRSPDGENWRQLYWVSGRSENSRNRVLAETDGEIQTVTADRSLQVDGTFTLYTALCSVDGAHIVGNGDQVATVARALGTGGSFDEALLSREVEKDPPIWTPRITAVLRGDSVRISRVDRSSHAFFESASLGPGDGICIHTYRGDGEPVTVFSEDPYPVSLSESAEKMAQVIKDEYQKLNIIHRPEFN